MMRNLKMSRIAVPLLVILFIACSTVPLTNRSQLNLISASEINTMSLQQYDEVKKTSKLSTNKAQVAMIQRVGKRISVAAEELLTESGIKMDFEWEFILIENDSMVNAWCMPGGKVAFYTGILPYTKTEAGVAVVMGHEVAHALAQHGGERMSQQMLAQLGMATLTVALQEKPETTQMLWMQAYGLGAQLGFLLPFSRKHESEADRIGLTIMAKAGYNPEEAVAFWQRMSQSGGAKPPEFMSTHPADDKRVAHLQKLMPEAMKHYKKQ
jgi:predicted Zn-dependent protease